jgi:hypothetical protein
VAAFNPALALHVDVDAVLSSFAAAASAAAAAAGSGSSGKAPTSNGDTHPPGPCATLQQQQQQRLLRALRVGGQQLPAAAAGALLQGGLARSLLQLQRTPQVACQVLQAGERLLHAVPLALFDGEPVRLVLLVELLTAASAGSGSSRAAHGTQAVFYAGRGIAPLADVYPAMRACGPVDWISWVKEAVQALAVEQEEV